MALVTFTGYPSSGKSRRAHELKSYLESRFESQDHSGPKFKVLLLSDGVLNVHRSAYDESQSEKPARSTLFTTVQRSMTSDTIVILDSLNYIKGFRYQLYCAAKEAGVRVCTIFAVATPDQCKAWNTARDETTSYKSATLDNLIMRYEEPSSMVRWDSPLFTVPWNEESLPMDDIWQAIVKGDIKPANAGTRAAPRAPMDALHTLETTTTDMVRMIVSEQGTGGGMGGAIRLALPSVHLQLQLPSRSITLSELQRMKRAFVATHKRAITQGATEKGSVDFTEEGVGRKFVEYLEQNLRS